MCIVVCHGIWLRDTERREKRDGWSSVVFWCSKEQKGSCAQEASCKNKTRRRAGGVIMTGERERERKEYDTQNRERSLEKIVTSLMGVGNRVEMSVGHIGMAGKNIGKHTYA